MFLTELQSAATDFGITLTNEQCNLFAGYYEMLIAWNERINLTTITAPRDVAVKHIIDSLAAYSAEDFATNGEAIDIGTGAGFPGIPLKIYRPEIAITLVDSLAKRVHFLDEVISSLQLNGIRTVHARAEDLGHDKDYRERFATACSRAVAPLNVLCEYALPLLKTGGKFVALKGAKHEEELTEAERAIKLLGGGKANVREIHLPGLDDVRAVISIEKVQCSPAKYPRRAGIPKRQPL